MIKELISKNRVIFRNSFDNWENAIKESCAPLIEQGAIKSFYADEIISNVKEYGAYIVIAPNICIPHAQEGLGVNETAISFMKTNEPVSFSDDPEQDSQLFFVLASENNDKHLSNLMALTELLDNEEYVNIMLNAQCVDDLKDLP